MKHNLDTNTNTLSIAFPGDVLSTNVDGLRQAAFGLLEGERLKQAPWTTLKLDLTAAKMVDSAGLNLIVSIIKHAKNRGAAVRATVGNPNVYRTFIFTRLDKQLDLSQAA
jgi:anti-anti-sigma factor